MLDPFRADHCRNPNMWPSFIALLTLVIASKGYVFDVEEGDLSHLREENQKNTPMPPSEILSWKDHHLHKYHSCSTWLESNTDVSEEDIKQLDNLLHSEKLSEYKKTVLSYAEHESDALSTMNETEECFNKLTELGMELERVHTAKQSKTSTNPLALKKTPPSALKDVLSPWQVQKLHAYWTQTQDSQSIVKALRHHLRQLPVATQSNFIDEFFDSSPEAQSKEGSVESAEESTTKRFRRHYNPKDIPTIKNYY